MRFGLSGYWCSLFGLFDLETSKYWIPLIFITKWSQKAKKIIILPFFDCLAFKMTFSAFFGLFQYLMGFSLSCKAISAIQCQIFAKTMFLGFWYKFSHNLPVCSPHPFFYFLHWYPLNCLVLCSKITPVQNTSPGLQINTPELQNHRPGSNVMGLFGVSEELFCNPGVAWFML